MNSDSETISDHPKSKMESLIYDIFEIRTIKRMNVISKMGNDPVYSWGYNSYEYQYMFKLEIIDSEYLIKICKYLTHICSATM